MGILLDLIFIGIVVVCVLISIKKGFVRSLIEVVGCILAIVIALSIGSVVANYVYDNNIEPAVVSSIENKISEKNEDTVASLPTYIQSFLDMVNVDVDSLTGTHEKAVEIAQDIKPAAVGAVKAIASFILFIILMIVVKILARLLNSLFKGAILGSANKLLGGLFGGVKGLVFASAFCMIVYFVASITASDFLFFSDDAIKGSFICEKVITMIIAKF